MMEWGIGEHAASLFFTMPSNLKRPVARQQQAKSWNFAPP